MVKSKGPGDCVGGDKTYKRACFGKINFHPTLRRDPTESRYSREIWHGVCEMSLSDATICQLETLDRKLPL